MCDDRFAGEMISTFGGSLSGGIASVVVVVVGRAVAVAGRVVDVVVVVGRVVAVAGRVVDVVAVWAVLVFGIVVEVDVIEPAAAVPVGSSVVESVSASPGEHAATSRSVVRPSAAIRTQRWRVRDKPTGLLRVSRRRDRRRLRSSVVRVSMRLVVSSIP